MVNNSIWSIDMTLSDTTNPDHSEPRSKGNEGVFYIPYSSRIWASPSDGLMSYPGHSLEESYPSAEMQSAYSTVLANWADFEQFLHKQLKFRSFEREWIK